MGEGPGRVEGASTFMRVRTAQENGSVAHDVVVHTAIVDVDGLQGVRVLSNSLQFSAWLRSAAPQATVEGVLAIWNLQLVQAVSPGTTHFVVGDQWTHVSVGFEDELGILADRPYQPNVRVEIYLRTVDQDLDVDAAVLI